MSDSTLSPLAYRPLALRAWPADTEGQRLMRAVFLALIGSLLLAISAKVQVPFWPVPMTMQTYVVVLLGAAYGWRLGAATVALYLMEGAMGLPVFAGAPERGFGLLYMAGPTGGYLIGFLVAAAVSGWLAEHGGTRSMMRLVGLFTVGHAIIFVLGVAWLAGFVGFEQAIMLGLAPFWLATPLKILLGVATLGVVDRKLRG